MCLVCLKDCCQGQIRWCVFIYLLVQGCAWVRGLFLSYPMWGISTLHALCHLVCFEVDTVITPILQMRKVKFQEVSVCARSLQPAKGCQGLSNFNWLSASSALCYIMLDFTLTPRIAQLISASLPFHPSQELPTFPGPFQVVPPLLSSPFPL